MPPRRAARSVSRKNTPLSPPKPTPPPPGDQAPIPTRRSTRATSREATDVQSHGQPADRLSRLAEEHEDSIGPDASASVAADELDDSDLESEIAALDRDEMIESLPALRDDSLKLLHIFEGQDDNGLLELCNQIAVPKSQPNRRFEMRLRRLLGTRAYYGGEDGFIRTNAVVRAFAGVGARDKLDDGPWRPDAVLYLANICLLLGKVLLGDADAMELMYNTFPSPFASEDNSRFDTNLADETFNLRMASLTQFFIERASSGTADSAFDPDDQLQKIFWDEDAETQQLEPAEMQKVVDHVDRIRAFVNPDFEDPVDLAGLGEEFPSADLYFKLATWAIPRSRELVNQISVAGGMDNICKRLTAKDFATFAELADGQIGAREEQSSTDEYHEAAQQLEADLAATQNGTTATSGARGLGEGKSTDKVREWQKLKANVKQFKQQMRQSGGRPELESRNQPTVEDEIPQSPEASRNDDEMLDGNVAIDDDEMVTDGTAESDNNGVSNKQVDMIMGVIKRQEAQAQKENKPSLLDRQASAHRLHWDEDDGQPGPSRQSSKRQRQEAVEDSNDDDEDDDFETDTRAVKKARKARDQPSIEATGAGNTGVEQPSPRKRGRPSKISSPQQAHSSTRPPAASQPSREPLRPIRLNDPPPSTAPAQSTSRRAEPAPTQRDAEAQHDFQIANARAKQNTAIHKFNEQQPHVQVRRPWSVDEVTRLIELIAVHGTGYAAIKTDDNAHEDGPQLESRSQVDLKDKARNLKMDFLKGGVALPPGFELVSIKKVDFDRLRGWGIEYVQGRYEGVNIRRQMERMEQGLDDDD